MANAIRRKVHLPVQDDQFVILSWQMWLASLTSKTFRNLVEDYLYLCSAEAEIIETQKVATACDEADSEIQEKRAMLQDAIEEKKRTLIEFDNLRRQMIKGLNSKLRHPYRLKLSAMRREFQAARPEELVILASYENDLRNLTNLREWMFLKKEKYLFRSLTVLEKIDEHEKLVQTVYFPRISLNLSKALILSTNAKANELKERISGIPGFQKYQKSVENISSSQPLANAP